MGLRFSDDALAMQFQCNLANGFDFRQVSHRSHILVSQIINDINIVLQAMLDQTTDARFFENPPCGVMWIVYRYRATPRPGGVMLAYLLDLLDEGIHIQP